MFETFLTALFLLIMLLAVYARLQQGSVRKVDVSSADMMQAIKKGKRTALDVKLELKQKKLKEKMTRG